MKKIKYLLKRIINMDFSYFFNTIKDINKKTNINTIKLFFDIIWCGFKYQAGYRDYYLFEFYNISKKDRKTIMTRGKNDKYIRFLNNPNYYHIFKNKNEFNKRFNKYIKRDWLYLNDNYDEFKKFIKNKEYIICKPIDGSCGKGIEKIKISKYESKELYDYLVSKKLYVLEELVIQNDSMSKLNPDAINTIRVVTINYKEKAEVVVAYLRIGASGKFVDNFNSGGMVVPVDVKTGKINYPALSKSGELFEKHPTTNTKIKGFQIPNWEEVKKIAIDASYEVKEIGMVGFDVAISNKGVLLIEANEYPGHDIYQLPPHRKGGVGVLLDFEKVLKL